MPPIAISWLSDELLQALSTFLAIVEDLGVWPSQISTLIICFIPKASGGRRPIGLLATPVKVWEQARKQQVVEWRITSGRQYNWMLPKRASERAVWKQTVLEEAAKHNGLASAVVLVDLIKAYETVLLGRTWQVAVRHGFPRRILRLALEASAFERRLTYQKAVGQPTMTLSAIVAGGAFSGDILLLTLLDPLDELLAQYKDIQAFVIADDRDRSAR